MNKLSPLYAFMFSGRFVAPLEIKLLFINDNYIVYKDIKNNNDEYCILYAIKNKKIYYKKSNEVTLIRAVDYSDVKMNYNICLDSAKSITKNNDEEVTIILNKYK
jgi:hypothetical protein